MPVIRGQRGEGRLGCLVILVLAALFVFLCFKVIPVYLEKLDFEDGLDRLASKAGVENWSADVVEERARALAERHGFKVAQGGIQVQRPLGFEQKREIKIEVRYQKEVEFPGYTHVLNFTSRAASFIGRL